jgi:hypothetical protein
MDEVLTGNAAFAAWLRSHNRRLSAVPPSKSDKPFTERAAARFDRHSGLGRYDAITVISSGNPESLDLRSTNSQRLTRPSESYSGVGFDLERVLIGSLKLINYRDD